MNPLWLAEADKIIAAYPEKHREYHALVLKNAWERGRMEGLLWARGIVVPDGNPELVIDRLTAELARVKTGNGVTCEKCGGYLPGHATGGADICTCIG